MTESGSFSRFAATEIDQSIPERFATQVQRHGHRLAVSDGTVSYDYRALDRQRSRIARAILDIRGDRSEPVALCLRQGAPLIAAILGTVSAGKFYVPVDTHLQKQALERILLDCNATLILADSSTRRKASEIAGSKRTVLDIGCIDDDGDGSNPVSPRVPPDCPVYIYYTSGSTGTPKGVVDSHRNLLHNVMRYTNSLEISPRDRLSLVQSSNFSGAASNVFCAVLNGASVHPFDLRGQHARRLAAWVRDERLTIFHSVPTIFERLAGACPAMHDLRIVRLEGDRATRRHIDLFRRHFDGRCRLVNGLGTTETGIVCQYFIGGDTRVDADAVPVGYALQDMEILVLDDDGRPVPGGAIGEIAVRSRYLATGYWKRPQLTGTAFVPAADGKLRTYRTGDLGSAAPDGCVTWIGRKALDIKVRGQRVDVPAIENLLRSIDGIDDAVLAMKEERPGAQQLVAYLTASGRAPVADRLRRQVANRFPDQPVPSRFVTIESLPTDANGKVDRRALPAPGSERPVLEEPFVAPRTARERNVAACFSEVLGIAAVGVNDHFLDLGGDSLRAVELALLLEKRMARRLSSELFWDDLTVAQVAGYLGQERESPGIVALRSGGSSPPLFLFHSYSGLVLEYRKLALGLTDDRPVFAVQYTGKPERYVEAARMQDLAAHYRHEIRRIEPCGPYLLAGQCFGGLVAFEVARQLRAEGNKVELLALIDTVCPTGGFDQLPHQFSAIRQLPRLFRASNGMRHLGTRVRNASRFAVGVGWRLANRTAGLPLPRFLRRPTDIHRLAEAKYRVMPYDGHIVSIVVGTPHSQAAWQDFAGDGLTLVQLPVVPGADTNAHLTGAPYLDGLTDALNGLL